MMMPSDPTRPEKAPYCACRSFLDDTYYVGYWHSDDYGQVYLIHLPQVYPSEEAAQREADRLNAEWERRKVG